MQRTIRAAKAVARINGRLLFYIFAPILLLFPIIARDGQPWHFLISVPSALLLAVVSICWIWWGHQPQN
jgi:hypothetical protein